MMITAFSVESARYSFSSAVSVVAVSSWMFEPSFMRPRGLSDFMSYTYTNPLVELITKALPAAKFTPVMFSPASSVAATLFAWRSMIEIV